MKENKEKCSVLRAQADNRQGKINLLEREIQDRKHEIQNLKQEIRSVKNEYKDLATQYGVSLAPVNLSRNIPQNIIDNIGMVSDKINAPDGAGVENALIKYNNTKMSNEREISNLEREIGSIGRDINNIQRDKESLVQEMRSTGCYSR